MPTRCATQKERAVVVKLRQVRMLRRSTLNFYYNAQQVVELLHVLVRSAHLEACVILFSRILDMENHHPELLLTELEYAGADFTAANAAAADKDLSSKSANFKSVRTDVSCYLMRLGPANCFNPFRPDRAEITDEQTHSKYGVVLPCSSAGMQQASAKPTSPNAAAAAAAPQPAEQLLRSVEPERYGGPAVYRCDLRHFDERVVCKMLVCASTYLPVPLLYQYWSAHDSLKFLFRDNSCTCTAYRTPENVIGHFF